MHRKLMLSSILIGMWLVPQASAADDKAPSLFGRDNDEVRKKEPYQVVHGWPQLPDGFTLGQVSGVGVDSHNHVFAFHRGAQYPIMMFDGATGKFLKSLGEGMFMHPHGLSVDNQDNLWITDALNGAPTGLHQVFKLSHEGKILMTLGTKGVAGWDASHFNHPTDVAVAANGDIYISDGYGNARIAKFDSTGKFLFDWGTKGNAPGQFGSPHSITLDDQGRVYVADRPNARIEVFDPNGKLLNIWKGGDLLFPWALRYHAGFIYVSNVGDAGRGGTAWPFQTGIIKMDLNGKIVDKWSRWGKYDGQLASPHAIAVAPNGDVYTGEVGVGMRVQKFVPAAN